VRASTDGVVTIRPPRDGDAAILIAGRDDEFRRFLGEGGSHPQPTGVIEVDGEVVGWVDYDVDRVWLEPGEVNIGYNVFAAHRGNGHGTRAVELLLRHLAEDTEYATATLLIDAANERSQALARRIGCGPPVDFDGNQYFKRPIRPGANVG
jgi:RimJ/RimL family protein N-acetyltransferase